MLLELPLLTYICPRTMIGHNRATKLGQNQYKRHTIKSLISLKTENDSPKIRDPAMDHLSPLQLLR